ncbi:hypothetical protein TCAL_14451 [Tigriopus californicus]|uniref:VM domain-containing protein n=1 Tax=Tigriopus californicus TaxID=6832 RepID=A0A553PM82_TIGCA|nr:uncharacterized protein LOC131889812 [Tigriopus californicus]TRY78791.1 hypothetical protein TCAL_14451 [Tigriopus californicus]
MKTFIALFALVAAVCAEADPYLLYNGAYGYAGLGAAPLAYAGYTGVPLAYASPYALGKSAPCVNAANVPVPCAAAHYVKREAEAEAEADPAYLYAGLATPYATGYNGIAHVGAYNALPYAYNTGYPYAYNAGLIHSSRVGVCTNYVGQQVPC